MKSRLPLNPEKLKSQSQRLQNKDPFDALVLRVCDGDTIVVAADWDGVSWSRAEYIRLAAIDAPEMRGPDARLALWAQSFLEDLILQQVVTVRPRRIWRDPYSRIIASVTFKQQDIGTCLMNAGHAVRRPKVR